MELLRHCAYNQTRDRLLGTDVAAADFSDASLQERLPDLKPNSGSGLWMIPFRGLPFSDARVPLDLIYLDEQCRVIAAVESFPLSQVSPSIRPAASVLAMPAQTIVSSDTKPGDQLLLCTSEELKVQLRRATQAAASSAANNAGTSLMPPQTEAAPPPAKNAKPKSWWQKLINPDPPDSRRAPRERLPGLFVYYWTGGTPTPNPVRDISQSGCYVLTNERWYPGTIMQMTLAGKDKRGFEHSITVQSRAVRWGNDGVGLEFVLNDPKTSARGEWLAPSGANREQFSAFLAKIKS
jgi:hypothetical protein